jgi:hypothetical protein
MQTAYPIVCALRNKDLKNYHRVKIKDTIRIDEDIKEDQFTLQFLFLVESRAKDDRKELTAISDEVSMEAVLSNILHTVQDKWNNIKFHTKIFRANSYLSVDIDDLMRDLDDAIV